MKEPARKTSLCPQTHTPPADTTEGRLYRDNLRTHQRKRIRQTRRHRKPPARNPPNSHRNALEAERRTAPRPRKIRRNHPNRQRQEYGRLDPETPRTAGQLSQTPRSKRIHRPERHIKDSTLYRHADPRPTLPTSRLCQQEPAMVEPVPETEPALNPDLVAKYYTRASRDDRRDIIGAETVLQPGIPPTRTTPPMVRQLPPTHRQREHSQPSSPGSITLRLWEPLRGRLDGRTSLRRLQIHRPGRTSLHRPRKTALQNRLRRC